MTRASMHVLEPARAPRFGDGGPTIGAEPAVNNALLAVLLFMGAEVMLFTGMLGAFVLYRTSSIAWPPPAQPMLPIGVTLGNTAVLLASAVTMWRAYAAARQGDVSRLCSSLAATAAMGVAFVAVQGYEWIHLIRYGLTMTSSTYGATFYSLIGLHAAHVVGAVIWLLVVLANALRGRYTARRHTAVQVCGVYWGFVCALWLVLFSLVYLA